MMLNFLWRVSIYKLSHCLNNYHPQFNRGHFFWDTLYIDSVLDFYNPFVNNYIGKILPLKINYSFFRYCAQLVYYYSDIVQVCFKFIHIESGKAPLVDI